MRDEHTVICSPAVFELIAPDAPVVPVKVDLSLLRTRLGHGFTGWVAPDDVPHCVRRREIQTKLLR